MSDKTIFQNYQSCCPTCGAELDSEHKECPYCGQKLEKLNEAYRDNEAIISNAIEDINNAKRELKKKEKIFNESKRKSTSSKILKTVLILFILNIVLFIIVAAAVTINESIVQKKIEALRSELRNQSVEVINVELADLDGVEFVDTNKQSAVGYIQESESLLKIPFYESDYSNEGVFKGSIYLDKEGFVEISRYDDYSASIRYENFSISIRCSNATYYDDVADLLMIYSDEIDSTKRLDNFQVGDTVFECYFKYDEYNIIAEPYIGCFIEYEIYPSTDDGEINVEEAFKIVGIDSSFEIS